VHVATVADVTLVAPVTDVLMTAVKPEPTKAGLGRFEMEGLVPVAAVLIVLQRPIVRTVATRPATRCFVPELRTIMISRQLFFQGR
jgi:hypothetical protein